MSAILIIENALDRYLALMAGRVDPEGFQVKTLAHIAEVSRSLMSDYLQDYRQAQEQGRTRYVLGCEGYGRAARWRILRKPGATAMAIEKAKARHAGYINVDALKRLYRDVLCEVRPGLTRSQKDRRVDNAVNHAVRQMQLNVDFHLEELQIEEEFAEELALLNGYGEAA